VPTKLEEIIEAQNIQTKQLPPTLLHCKVVMAMMMPDAPGLLPRRHIVTLRNPDKPEQRAYSTHYVAYQPGWKGQDGPWVLAYGHYDKTRESAIRDMIIREADER
jgi:hypothetical protein